MSDARGWSGGGSATTLVLIRHGATAHSADKRFSGGITGGNPPLNELGRSQVEATAAWLSDRGIGIDVLVTSPVRRTQESAEILSATLGVDVREVVDGMAEMDFGTWDGFTFADVHRDHPDELSTWLTDHGAAAGGGESFQQVRRRVLEARDGLLDRYAGATVGVVTHVSPIKILVADAVGAGLDALYRMELTIASVTEIGYYADDAAIRPSLRLFNATPAEPSPA